MHSSYWSGVGGVVEPVIQFMHSLLVPASRHAHFTDIPHNTYIETLQVYDDMEISTGYKTTRPPIYRASNNYHTPRSYH